MRAPLIVVPSPADVDSTARRLREGGRQVQNGFTLPDEPFDLTGERLLCAGVVAEPGAATAAVVAAVRGTGLIVCVQVLAPSAADFLEDLTRIGPVVVAPAASVAVAPKLSPEQRQLLDLLAGGATVPDAARQLYLSVRTAERRVGEIRRALGVRTTAEAVVAVGRTGSGGDWGWPAGGSPVPSDAMEPRI